MRKLPTVVGARTHAELNGITCIPMELAPATRKSVAATRKNRGIHDEDLSLPTADKITSALSSLIKGRDLARQTAADPELVILNGARVRVSTAPLTEQESQEGVISFEQWRRRLRPAGEPAPI